eukprot:5543987-Pleurochrysis_carterae.AAC.5
MVRWAPCSVCARDAMMTVAAAALPTSDTSTAASEAPNPPATLSPARMWPSPTPPLSTPPPTPPLSPTPPTRPTPLASTRCSAERRADPASMRNSSLRESGSDSASGSDRAMRREDD